MNRDEYLQVHQNTLLITPSKLEEVNHGIAASGSNATVTQVDADWRVGPYSDAPPVEGARKETRYLVTFDGPDDGAKFQAWYDAQQSNPPRHLHELRSGLDIAER